MCTFSAHFLKILDFDKQLLRRSIKDINLNFSPKLGYDITLVMSEGFFDEIIFDKFMGILLLKIGQKLTFFIKKILNDPKFVDLSFFKKSL